MYEAMRIASELHPAWYRCSIYAKKLHGRNAAITLGESLRDPVAAVVCWTKNAEVTGGTGMAMRIAEANGIAIFNMARLDRGEIEARMTEFMDSDDGVAA